MKKGFTLIEILIVVAIIAILASIVLVGLGPTQSLGRDSRRLSDIRQVQNALELFYNKCGFYPGTISSGNCTVGTAGAGWADFASGLKGASLGVNTIPSDPSSNRSYEYAYFTGNTSYLVGAALENANNTVFNGYTAPDTANFTWTTDTGKIMPANDCSANATYCVSI